MGGLATLNGAMRGLAAIFGLATAAGGFALVVYQAFLWFRHGTWTPVPFSDMWFACGGIAPEMLQPGRIQDFLEGLMTQPLSLILFLVGGAFAWLGTSGGARPWTKL